MEARKIIIIDIQRKTNFNKILKIRATFIKNKIIGTKTEKWKLNKTKTTKWVHPLFQTKSIFKKIYKISPKS